MWKSERLQKPLSQLLIALIFLSLAGCAPKIVRVPVPPEDVLRASQIANEGDIAFARKDYYAALIKYLEASRLNPYDELILNRLGITYCQLNFYSEGLDVFERVVALNPKLAFALNNIGSVYFAQQNLNKAEKFFKKAIHEKKDESSFYMNLASLYLEKKKPDKAMEEWRKALAIDPNAFGKKSAVILGSSGNSSPMEKSYFIARLYASMGDVESAIENLKEAFNQGFSDIEAINKQKDFDLIRKDPRFSEFVEELSVLIKLRKGVGPQIRLGFHPMNIRDPEKSPPARPPAAAKESRDDR
jgi:tetratricopeptide (TPR) repeat protein